MSQLLHKLIKNQTQVKVARHAHNADVNSFWFVTLAVFFAGVFYFFGFYFWSNLWSVLTGS
jgi:hypothetical protein